MWLRAQGGEAVQQSCVFDSLSPSLAPGLSAARCSWGASVPRRKRGNPRLRWRKKYEELLSIENAAQELGEYIVKWLDEALEASRRGAEARARRLIRRVLRRGHASMLGKRKDKAGKTVFTDHLVVNGRGRIRHYGIHGIQGWNPERPDEVQFKNKRGEDLEYEEIGPYKGGRRIRAKKRRGRGWKRAS